MYYDLILRYLFIMEFLEQKTRHIRTYIVQLNLFGQQIQFKIQRVY